MSAPAEFTKLSELRDLISHRDPGPLSILVYVDTPLIHRRSTESVTL